MILQLQVHVEVFWDLLTLIWECQTLTYFIKRVFEFKSFSMKLETIFRLQAFLLFLPRISLLQPHLINCFLIEQLLFDTLPLFLISVFWSNSFPFLSVRFSAHTLISYYHILSSNHPSTMIFFHFYHFILTQSFPPIHTFSLTTGTFLPLFTWVHHLVIQHFIEVVWD